MRRNGAVALALFLCSGILVMLSPPAWAVPAFARRYGTTCSTCHTSWPALNSTGMYFKLSGYRRLNGEDLKPTTQDIELAMGALSIPSIPPLALTVSTGFDYESIRRRAADDSRASQSGNSLDLNNATLFVATPLGKNLSAFFEFPLFETKAPANDFPTGPSGANATDVTSKRDLTFESEVTGFEMGKMQWNSLLPESIGPLDSLNLKAGVDQLPLGFSAEANRMSIRNYLIYRRRALDLLSPTQTDEVVAASNEADRLNRLGEPQLQVALNGVLVLKGRPTDLGKFETPAIDYEVGITNGSNNNAAPRTEKDFFGHLALAWFGQRFGFFGYYSPDIYDDNQRADGSITNGGVLSGQQLANRTYAFGPDVTLSLEPLDIPVWLETQVLFNREGDPTGFKKPFSWWGGFGQINGKAPVRAKFLQWITAYARYEWLRGDRFNDIPAGGVTGIIRPREWQVVAGLQWFILENLKIVTEFSRRQFENNQPAATLATAPDLLPHHQRLTDDFFTVRAAIGF